MIIKSINKTIGYKGLPDGFHVNFNEDVTYIVGDNFKTKSTILSVPLWVLTGYSMTGNNQENVSDDKRKGITNVIAEITIIDNEGNQHTISRSKGKNNIILLDGIRTTREYMARFYKDIQFFLCAYNPYRFSTLEGAKQKELLLRLLPAISEQDAFKLLSKEEQDIIVNPVIDTTQYAKQKRADIKEYNFEIKRIEGIEDNCLETAILKEDEELTFTKQERLNELQEQYDKLLIGSDDTINIEDLTTKIERLTNKLNQCLKVDLVDAKEKKMKIKEKIKNISINKGVCPTCKQEIENEAIKKALERQYNKELQILEDNIKNMKEDTKQYLKELQDKKELLTKLNTEENKTIQEKRKQIKKEIEELENEKHNIDLHNQEVLSKKEAIRKAKEQIEKARETIKDLENKIKLCKSQIKISDKLKMLIIDEQMKQAKGVLKDVNINFYKIEEDTGELVEDYSITYKGREYTKLAQSEKMRADFEICNLINKKSDINTAMFIDDTERIRDISVNDGTQIIMALYIKYSELDIFYDYNDVLKRKKESIDKQLEEDKKFIYLNAA